MKFLTELIAMSKALKAPDFVSALLNFFKKVRSFHAPSKFCCKTAPVLVSEVPFAMEVMASGLGKSTEEALVSAVLAARKVSSA